MGNGFPFKSSTEYLLPIGLMPAVGRPTIPLQYSASLGLVPKQNSSGNKERLLSITKRGDVYLRTLLIHGSRAYLRFASRRTDKKSLWAIEKVQKRGFNRAAVAVDSKNARSIWAMMNNNTDYHVAA